MTHCSPRAREQARDIADQLAAQPAVAAVDVLDPATGPTDEWTVELTVPRQRVPPEVSLAVGAHGLETETVQPQADHQRVVARLPV